MARVYRNRGHEFLLPESLPGKVFFDAFCYHQRGPEFPLLISEYLIEVSVIFYHEFSMKVKEIIDDPAD